MQVSIADVLRMAADKPEFPFSKTLSPLLTEIGKRKWQVYKDDPEGIREKASEAIKPLIGHGISQDAADKFLKAIEDAPNAKEILKVIGNYALAGAGLKVIKAADKKLTITIDLSNDAFQEDMNAELARIFLDLSKDYQFARRPKIIKDSNGKKIGEIKLTQRVQDLPNPVRVVDER